MTKTVLLGSVLALLLGCYTTRVAAPAGSTLTMATAGDLCTPASDTTVHYLLWGLVPLGDNTSASIMPSSGKVRVIDKTSFGDGVLRIIGMMTGGLYAGSKTIAVESCQ